MERKEVEGTLDASKVSKLNDWDGGDRIRSRLGKKYDEFRLDHLVCEVTVRYPAKDSNWVSEV